MLTAQQVFDQTIDKIIAQGEPGVRVVERNIPPCRHPRLRGDKGTMCAVGQWLPDSCYAPAMDGYLALASVLLGDKRPTGDSDPFNDMLEALFVHGLGVYGVDLKNVLTQRVLHTLQRAHDGYSHECGEEFVRAFLLHADMAAQSKLPEIDRTHLHQRAQELGMYLPVNKE